MITSETHTRNVSEISSFIMPLHGEKIGEGVSFGSTEESAVIIFKLNEEILKIKKDLEKA